MGWRKPGATSHPATPARIGGKRSRISRIRMRRRRNVIDIVLLNIRGRERPCSGGIGYECRLCHATPLPCFWQEYQNTGFTWQGAAKNIILRGLWLRSPHRLKPVVPKNKNGSLWLPLLGIFPSCKNTPAGLLVQGTNWPAWGLCQDGGAMNCAPTGGVSDVMSVKGKAGAKNT